MRPLPVTPFAAMPPGVLGLARIRGEPVPVVDPGTLLGCREDPRPTRFVTLRTGSRTVALAVEEVIGVRHLGAASLGELPPLLAGIGAATLAAIGELDGDLLTVLRHSGWVPESLWSALAAGTLS